MLDRVYLVCTPENLVLRFQRGGLATRALALVIDMAGLALLLQLAAWTLVASNNELGTALWIVGAFLAQWWYGALLEWQTGCTVGKRLMGLAVIDAAGMPPSLLQAAARNLMRLVDLLPGLHLVGAAVCLMDPHGRRLGDLAAQTVVVRRAPAADAGAARVERIAGLQPYAEALALRLRPDERTAVHGLVAVLGELPLGLRLRLCDELAGHLSRRYQLERPAWLGSERALRQIDDASQALTGRGRI